MGKARPKAAPLGVDIVSRRLAAAEDAARELFGYKDGLRPLQRQAIEGNLRGTPQLVVFATGGGKSACFQLPAIVRPGLTLVISPLIALMKDQVEKLKRWGVAAEFLSHDVEVGDADSILRDLGSLSMLYVAPERCKNKALIAALKAVRVSGLVIDEAHVLSKWGKEFRASYAKLGDVRRAFPDAALMALTATADPEVEFDVCRILKLKPGTYTRIVSSPHRPNLNYRTSHDVDVHEMAEVLRSQLARGGSVLVYAASRKATEDIALNLRNCGIADAHHYHAGMEKSLRSSVQERFMDGELRCIVATNAFGMGVDKADVRLVYHWHAPGSVFDYVQEAGRAGRDGEPATCYLNISRDGKRRRDFFIRCANPDLWIYEKLWKHLSKFGKIGRGEVCLTSRERIGEFVRTNEAMRGQIDSALAFMEFNDHIEIIPGPRVYRLPIKSPHLARSMARRFRGVKVEGNVCTVRIEPDDDDPVPELVANGAVHDAPPQEAMAVRLKVDDLAVTEDAIEEKRAKAYLAFHQVEQFAKAGNKQAFLDHIFLRSNT